MEVSIYDLSTSAQATMKQMFGQMQLVDRVPGLSSIMRATPSFLDRASIFSLYFLGKMDEYGSSDLVEGLFDGATPEDDYRHELDLLIVKKFWDQLRRQYLGCLMCLV